MAGPPQRIVIVGATGPAGILLADELLARGRRVRVASRSRERLEHAFSGRAVEIAVADALDAGATRAAVAGCDLVVDCIGLPAERFAEHPRTASIVLEAARAAGARCLQVSSYWAFFPQRREVIDESHPRQGGHPWFRLRRQAEDLMLAAGAAVVHLPDFFGPHVHTSTVQLALEQAVAGQTVTWLGGGDQPRDSAYLPDAVKMIADLLDRDEAYGADWALPGSGPITARGLVLLAEQHLGRPVRLQSMPRWLLRLLALAHPELRAVRPMIPQYARPVRYDATRLRRLLGNLAVTPYEQAVPATLDWIGARARS